MNASQTAYSRSTWPLAAALAVSAWVCTAAFAAPTVSHDQMREAEARYRSERSACLDGSSAQDRTTCLYEANSALAQARRGQLDSGETPANLQRNALTRCEVVPADDRAACISLARGEGEQSGSVAGGGVYKQIVTRVVVPAPAASAPSAP